MDNIILPEMSAKYGVKRILGICLIIIGILVAAYPALTIPYGYYRQWLLHKEWNEQKKKRDRDQENARQGKTTPSTSLPVLTLIDEPTLTSQSSIETTEPFPLTKIVIPKIGLNQIVKEGIMADVLREGPGHYPGTANPGEVGWCAIAGHRVTFSKPFNRLDELSKGDTIILETPEASYIYTVFLVEQVPATSPFKMDPVTRPNIVLTTCAPKGSARDRLAVRGTLPSRPRAPRE